MKISSSGPRRRPGVKPQVKTWFSMWMILKNFTNPELAVILMTSRMVISRWRTGGPMGRHFASLLRALYPECPISAHGGRPPTINEPIPVNARTPALYRQLLKTTGLINPSQTVWAVALEEARRIRRTEKSVAPKPAAPSEPGQGPVLPG